MLRHKQKTRLMTDFFSKRKAAMALDTFIYHFKSIPDKKKRRKEYPRQSIF